MFFGKQEQPKPLRNRLFTGDRELLKFDAGEVTVSGANPDFGNLSVSRANGTAKELQVEHTFWNKPVSLSLGTITTDDEGRLLVLGGYGESKSPTNRDNLSLVDEFTNFANHDEWYDDVCDGKVSVKVTLKEGGQPLESDAWVVTAPPKYAPDLQTPVTLYDALLQRAIDEDKLPDPSKDPNFKPSLSTDILPILIRAANMRWVYANRKGQVGPPRKFHASFASMPPEDKAQIFERLSIPNDTPGGPGQGDGDMPRNWSDLYRQPLENGNAANGTLTKTQYLIIRKWKDGDFVQGSVPSPSDPITPEGLTRAALEPCVGGPLYPGIEVSWKIRDTFKFVEPFRLDASQLKPGDITAQMSLPWQSDFLDCGVESAPGSPDLVWWPAQRPINVFKSGGDRYVPWARKTDADDHDMSVKDLVANWFKLAFLVKGADGKYEEELRK
jgi:L-Lysine epsilon oxidase N-terminal/L-lysine epsilon oxidase C-terminal domain